jgi:hypothetical protein
VAQSGFAAEIEQTMKRLPEALVGIAPAVDGAV